MVELDNQPSRFVIHDRDTIYLDGVGRTLEAMGLTVPIHLGRSYWCRGFSSSRRWL
jgi:hypothetical protein